MLFTLGVTPCLRDRVTDPKFEMLGVAALCVLLATVAVAAAEERGNCEKYCDVGVNGTAPPAEWCYCYAGEVSRNGRSTLKRLRDVLKDKSGMPKETIRGQDEVSACASVCGAVSKVQ